MGNTCRTCGRINPHRTCSVCRQQAPKKPACGNTPNVINLKETEYVAFRFVHVPASYGDETAYPLPKLENAILIYDINGHSYLYDSGGIANRIPDVDTPEKIAALQEQIDDIVTELVQNVISDSDWDSLWES